MIPIGFENQLDQKYFPLIDGIYDEKFLKGTKYENILKPVGYDNKKTVIFISHAHLDHTAGLDYVDPAIDVYADFGISSLYINLSTESNYYLNLKNTHKIIEFDQKYTFGEISITPIRGDHNGIPFGWF